MTARLRALLAELGLAADPVPVPGPVPAPAAPGMRFTIDLPDDADPVRPVLASLLGENALPLRWAIGIADDPAAARKQALDALEPARLGRRRLVIAATRGVRVHDLDDRAAVLEALLLDMTPRQGEIARRHLLEGRRQAEIAADLGVSRATVAVSIARGRVAAIAAAHRLLRSALAMGGDGATDGDCATDWGARTDGDGATQAVNHPGARAPRRAARTVVRALGAALEVPALETVPGP